MQPILCERSAVQDVSLSDLARVLFGKDHAKGKFCMLAFYMAYSANEEEKAFYIVSGILTGIGASEFFETEEKWKERLKRDGLKYFRPGECAGLDGEFKKLVNDHGPTKARALADDIMKDLKHILWNATIQSYCYGNLTSVYSEAVAAETGAVDVFGNDPCVFAHQELIIQVAQDTMKTVERWGEIAFVYDALKKNPINGDSLDKFKKRNSECAGRIRTIVPLDDQTTPCLQMAHLITDMTADVYRAHRNKPKAEIEEELKKVIPGFKRLY